MFEQKTESHTSVRLRRAMKTLVGQEVPAYGVSAPGALKLLACSRHLSSLKMLQVGKLGEVTTAPRPPFTGPLGWKRLQVPS